jgi:hypothetical protein
MIFVFLSVDLNTGEETRKDQEGGTILEAFRLAFPDLGLDMARFSLRPRALWFSPTEDQLVAGAPTAEEVDVFLAEALKINDLPYTHREKKSCSLIEPTDPVGLGTSAAPPADDGEEDDVYLPEM